MISAEPQVYVGHDLEALTGLDNYYGWILETFSPCLHGDVLEIGAGAGEFSQRLLPRASSLELVEPSPDLAARLRDRFAGIDRVAVTCASLESRLRDASPNTWDAVVMVNVLEHIEDDDDALRRIFRALRPGGALCLFVPALPLLFSRFDREIGHHRRYLRAPLRAQLTGVGFDVPPPAYRDAPGVVPWFLLQTVAGATRLNPRLARLYDRLFVPVIRVVENTVALPFGKNIIAVARKPGADS